jgi:SMI1/KNR4 family protein SUKH-1
MGEERQQPVSGAAWGRRGAEVAPLEGGVLERVLRQLKRLAERSPFQVALDDRPNTRPVFLSCALQPPAALEEVDEVELRLNTRLPDDYRRFLLFADGATLLAEVGPDGATDGGAELLGAAALLKRAEETACDYHDWGIPDLLTYASLGSDGDSLAFEIGRRNPYGGCAVLDARRNYRPDQWWVIARDFVAWLSLVLDDLSHPRSFGRVWDLPGGAQPALPLVD